MGAVSSVVEAVGDVGQGLIDVVSDAGSALDDAVRENIPGGWAIPVAVATAGALAPEAFGAAAAGEAAGAGLAEGAFPGLVEGTVASDAGIAALAPEAAAAVTSPVTSGAVAESAIPPVEYAPEVNIGTAAPYVPEYAPEVNVGTAAPPMNEGIAALPAEPVSGMDLAADATKGNTIAEAGQGIAALPAEPVSGMDLAADATPGNTITEAGTAVGAPTGLTTDANQTAAETNRLLGQEATAAGTPTGTTPGWLGGLADATGIPVGVLNGLAASLGISALGNALQPGTVTNAQGSYTGPLANIQYNPGTYTPYTYKPYAGGGAVEGMSNANAIGANTGFPMADIQRSAYSTPYQQPISQNVVTGDQDTRVDPYTGEERLAGGGITGSGELNLNIPLNFGGGAVGGFGQSPNGIGLNINQGPLDLGQGNNSGFGQANANGYKAAGSGTSFSSSLTGSPNTVGLSQNPFSMLLPGGYNPPAKYSAEQVNPTGLSFEEMVKRQQGLDAQRATPQMQERLAEQTIREAKAAEDAKKYTRDFNSFGFDKKLLDYLNNQRLASTYDGGIDYGYDPVTQTFRGGSRMGPVTKTLDEMQAYADKGMASGGLAALAAGGMYNLGGYSDGGRLLRGPGDGVSDSIPAVIGGKQPARLADGEFVIPARIVSELGNGSTEAGARQLYAMMDRIQAARRKTVGKDKVAANTKAAKHLPA